MYILHSYEWNKITSPNSAKCNVRTVNYLMHTSQDGEHICLLKISISKNRIKQNDENLSELKSKSFWHSAWRSSSLNQKKKRNQTECNWTVGCGCLIYSVLAVSARNLNQNAFDIVISTCPAGILGLWYTCWHSFMNLRPILCFYFIFHMFSVFLLSKSEASIIIQRHL